MKIACVFASIVLGLASFGLAQHEIVDSNSDSAIGTFVQAPETHELPYPHPRLSHEPRWAGVMAFVIVPAMFLAAAMIGMLVYAEMPEERPPVTHSHDEPPGSSHHHGPGGTVQPGPEHELPGGHAHH